MGSKTQNRSESPAVAVQPLDPGTARGLILDELFDLSLYIKLREIGAPEVRKMLDDLIAVETQHLAFWQDFFEIRISALNPARRLKLRLITLICRIFGAPAVDLILEAIEVYGIRKYLEIWGRYKDNPLGEAVRGILQDEFKHEDTLVTRLKERMINPDRVRNIFLGLNDGMIEILGAVSGFFASLGENNLVLIAGLTTAAAGSLSMAAGAYVAAGSENEMRRTQDEKNRFLGAETGPAERKEPAFGTAAIVGASFFIGAAFPLLPVLFGAQTAFLSILSGGGMILLVSSVLAFLSGMEIKKRTLTNLVIIAAAFGVSYAIGSLVRILWGVDL